MEEIWECLRMSLSAELCRLLRPALNRLSSPSPHNASSRGVLWRGSAPRSWQDARIHHHTGSAFSRLVWTQYRHVALFHVISKQWSEKVFSPLCLFLHLCNISHLFRFTSSHTNIHEMFLNYGFIYWGKTVQTLLALCEKVTGLAPKSWMNFDSPPFFFKSWFQFHLAPIQAWLLPDLLNQEIS